uniref:HAD-superfamily hydrolase n=2 Tax=Loa loa TaxID=7209 RepID=A0A1I7W272_LOALO
MPENKKALKITHVIFDLDGLLIDTEPTYTESHTFAMKHYGKNFTLDLKSITMGMTHDPAIKMLLDKVGLTDKVTVKEYDNFYHPILLEKLPQCPKMPGALRLVRHFHSHNIPMAICSGSSSNSFKFKTMNHKDLIDLIPLQVKCSSDPEIKEGKPSPEAYLVTMQRFRNPPVAPSNVLVFEDAPNGVLAAIRAGMNVIMVPDLRYAKVPDEGKEQVVEVLKSLEDFRPESVGLPAFGQNQ